MKTRITLTILLGALLVTAAPHHRRPPRPHCGRPPPKKITSLSSTVTLSADESFTSISQQDPSLATSGGRSSSGGALSPTNVTWIDSSPTTPTIQGSSTTPSTSTSWIDHSLATTSGSTSSWAAISSTNIPWFETSLAGDHSSATSSTSTSWIDPSLATTLRTTSSWAAASSTYITWVDSSLTGDHLSATSSTSTSWIDHSQATTSEVTSSWAAESSTYTTWIDSSLTEDYPTVTSTASTSWLEPPQATISAVISSWAATSSADIPWFDSSLTGDQSSAGSSTSISWIDPSPAITSGVPSSLAVIPSDFASLTTSTVTASVSVITTSTSSGTVQILPPLSTEVPDTTGTINTSLNTTGHATSAPIITSSISSPTSIISPITTATSVTDKVEISMTSDNIFQPVATGAPPANLGSRPDHPVPRQGVNQQSPISTNKFYANFFLGSQSAPSWTHPYSVAWSKGGGPQGSWGMAIMHIDANQKVFGPDNVIGASGVASSFLNPVGIQSLVLSEMSLGSSTSISMDSITDSSINVNFLPSIGAAPTITFPLVQGMGFITGQYNGGTPILNSGILFRTVTKATSNPKLGVTKYTIVLEDGKTWLLYASSPTGQAIDFTVVNSGLLQATSGFVGIIQIAKSPDSTSEALYDAACGAFATTATVSGSINGAQGYYTFSFTKAGMADTTLVMFALPHHLASFAPQTAPHVVGGVTLATTTKGQAAAVWADSWTLQESLPTTMGFAPWSPSHGNTKNSFSAAAMQLINSTAASEVSQDMNGQTNLNSMYFSGKALAKFAGIVYVLNDLVNNPALAQAGLKDLKSAFSVFVENRQQHPLFYESAWGGVVSSASYTTNDAGADFGNTYYNDHHFHYGYFIYAASIIAHLDPSWLTADSGANKAYINTLVRDIANPSALDPYFPVSRSFDWYHGHSWAHGLYESFDGKDQESSSEDSMSAYALKMWGFATGDSNLEARGNLQLAITARSLQNYFLYDSSNTVQPANFIGNKVSGILFENKIDHTTFFGQNIEYIQGIHMIPLLPSSTLTRTQKFVAEEWGTWFDSGRSNAVMGGWRGILYANLAIVDPVTSWEYFANPGFDVGTLDGGASRTWYLAWAAGLGGLE